MRYIRPAIAALASASLVATLLLSGGGGDSAVEAADAETASLISHFNTYRAQQGVAPLGTSGSLNQGAQAAAEESVERCSFVLPSGSGAKWGAYGYPTGDMLWQAYLNDPITLDWVGDAKYKSVGVGRAYREGCNYGYMWIMWLSQDGGGSTPAPTPTPTATPQPTPSPTPGQPATNTATPSPTATSNDTPTAIPTATPAPTAANGPVHGDGNCDGLVNLMDVMEIVKLIGGSAADTECLPDSGVDCAGGIDEADVLVLMRYLGGIPFQHPQGCPMIGAPASTPTPAPSPTVTPVSPPGGETSGVTDQCWLAIVVYDMTYPDVLSGNHGCQPEAGPAYNCDLPAGLKQVVCTTDADTHSAYDCYVFNTLAAPCVALDSSDTSDYVCERSDPVVCTSTGLPLWECAATEALVECGGPQEFSWAPGLP